jgi:hypothetical protein
VKDFRNFYIFCDPGQYQDKQFNFFQSMTPATSPQLRKQHKPSHQINEQHLIEKIIEKVE